MTLLCVVLIARNCHFVVEHPFQTLISRHRRWEWFCNQVCWVTWVKFKKMQLPSPTWDLLGIYIKWNYWIWGPGKFFNISSPGSFAHLRSGRSNFGRCTLGLPHQSEVSFSAIAGGSRVLTLGHLPKLFGRNGPSSKPPARTPAMAVAEIQHIVSSPFPPYVYPIAILGRTISKGGRKQFTGTSELKRTASHPHLSIYFHFGFFWPMHMPCWLQNNYTS